MIYIKVFKNRRRYGFKFRQIMAVFISITYACWCIINSFNLKYEFKREVTVSVDRSVFFSKTNESVTMNSSIVEHNGTGIYENEEVDHLYAEQYPNFNDSSKTVDTLNSSHIKKAITLTNVSGAQKNKKLPADARILTENDIKKHNKSEMSNRLFIGNTYNTSFFSNSVKNKHFVKKQPASLNKEIAKEANETTKHFRRLPQALIIGVKKCGTRALLEYLRIHPDIRAPGPEPHFFDKYYHLGLDWYRSQMPSSIEGQTTVEKTPRYFVSYEAPERVWNMSKETKIIMVVRDPVTRAISDFTQAATKQNYSREITFERKAFRRNGTGIVNTHWSAIKTGFYAQHLRQWLKYFPFSQIHLVSGEHLITNPAQELKSVQEFLGIKHIVTDKHFFFNETKGFPCLKTNERAPKTRCFNSSKGRPHSHVDESTLERLRLFFKPYNIDFYKLTKRDFGW